MSLAASSKRSRLIGDASEPVLKWAAHQLGIGGFREPSYALGIVDRRGSLIGAAVFNDFDARNVELTLVGGHAFRRYAAREVFWHAFVTLNCRRISLTVPENRPDTIGRAMKWGWVIEGRKRAYYDDCDAIILGMTRDECRFLRD